tara:strand:+ start:6400 stop:7383 length:984 start_codon:yes stop_codon:yes gene_type:complete
LLIGHKDENVRLFHYIVSPCDNSIPYFKHQDSINHGTIGIRFVKIGIMATRLQTYINQAQSQPTATGHLPGGQIRVGWISAKNQPAKRKFRILDEYHMLYLIRGQGQFDSTALPACKLQPGSRIDRHPKLPHTIVRQDIDQWLEFFITLSPSLHRAFMDMGILNPQRVISHVSITTSLIKDCLVMIDHMHATAANTDTVSRLVHLFGRFEQNMQANNHPVRLADQLQHAVHLLTDLRSQLTTLPDIAKQVGMTYENFRKQFAREFGKSPQQYRIEHRVGQAKHLLLETDISIESLAQELGYNDVFCFSRQFKTVCGMAPTRFRNQAN